MPMSELCDGLCSYSSWYGTAVIGLETWCCAIKLIDDEHRGDALRAFTQALQTAVLLLVINQVGEC
jgi:hypothetical protein